MAPPIGFSADSRPAGVIRLSWMQPSGEIPAGYHIYRSTQTFEDPTQAALITGEPVDGLFYEDLPDEEGTYYYCAVSVDIDGNESEMTYLRNAVSDATPPVAVSIDYTPNGAYDETTGRFGAGLIDIVLEVSEALGDTPFFSLNVPGENPMPVSLSKDSEIQYSGQLDLAPGSLSGTAYAVFNAKDRVGNTGNQIDAGESIQIDTVGPAVTQLEISPPSPIQNDETSPVTVTVTFSLNEAVESGTEPALSCLLSGAGRSPFPVENIVSSATAPGHSQTWQGDFALPADAGLTEVETFSFNFQGTDDLGNTGESILVANLFQVYQGDLPSLDSPENLVGQSLPGGDIMLHWGPVENAAGYQIYRQGPGESELLEYQRVGTQPEYLDSPDVEGTYVYAVASIRQVDAQEAVSAMSDSVQVVSDATAPAVPQNLAVELTSTGIRAVWTEVTDSDPVTYHLYRSDQPEIVDVAGLVPVANVVDAAEAVDSHPSSTHRTYAVTAEDPAGNASAPSDSVYLNFELLPVDNLAVVQADDQKPVITWSADGDSIVGFDIYLGPDTSGVQLNYEPLVQPTYTDVGYSGDTRTYTVVALDDGGHESLGRTITLPRIDMALAEGEAVHRNLMNRLTCQVENLTDAPLSNLTVTFDVASHTGHASETFDLDPNASSSVSATVGGYEDLPPEADLAMHLAIEPHPGESVTITRTGKIEVIDDTLVATILSDNWVRGGTASVQFALENTGEDFVEIITARNMGADASDEIQALLTDTDGNVLSEASLRQSQGEHVVTLADGTSIARIPAGDAFTSSIISLPVPANAPDYVHIKIIIDQIHHNLGEAGVIHLRGITTYKEITIKDTPYYGEIQSIDPAVSDGNQNIEIIGQALNRATNTPLPLVPLNLIIYSDGFEQIFEIFTDKTGQFVHTYYPTSTEYGTYEVRAVHPYINHGAPQGQFTIERVGLIPSEVNLSLARNYQKEVSVQVLGGFDTPANNLRLEYRAEDQSDGELPPGMHIQLPPAIETLEPHATNNFSVSLWGDNTAEESTRVVLNLASDEKASWGTLTINLHFSDAVPVLFFTPTIWKPDSPGKKR